MMTQRILNKLVIQYSEVQRGYREGFFRSSGNCCLVGDLLAFVLAHVWRADERIDTSADRPHFHFIRHQRSAGIICDVSVFECHPLRLFQHRCWVSVRNIYIYVWEDSGWSRGENTGYDFANSAPKKLRKTRKRHPRLADSWSEFEPDNTWV
jgi:hypothetical protein